MANATYLARFFAEKNLDERFYEVTAPDGTPHFIPTGAVIEAIMATTDGEQAQIAQVIRKLDFLNGDIHHFLKHLAGAMAARYDGILAGA